ncbi:MAG TPA: tetratricopeptide repeat protein [Candidatus Obscuribacterales bacterium]
MSSELVEVAILAYRNNRYRDAIELLLQVTDTEGDNWLARLYLGMSYQKTGRVADAARLFKRMVTDCPDQHIRSKAENALPLVEAEMRRRFQKDTAQPKQLSEESYGDIVWVANEKY